MQRKRFTIYMHAAHAIVVLQFRMLTRLEACEFRGKIGCLGVSVCPVCTLGCMSRLLSLSSNFGPYMYYIGSYMPSILLSSTASARRRLTPRLLVRGSDMHLGLS
jgi:hypothetical protein